MSGCAWSSSRSSRSRAVGVDRRPARRYVAALQDLGIPIEGQRGVGGGYRIRPGYRLPPLMLTDDEAVVVALGTLTAGLLAALALRRLPTVRLQLAGLGLVTS